MPDELKAYGITVDDSRQDLRAGERAEWSTWISRRRKHLIATGISNAMASRMAAAEACLKNLLAHPDGLALARDIAANIKMQPQLNSEGRIEFLISERPAALSGNELAWLYETPHLIFSPDV